jgi:hypothetical protein
VEEEQRASKNKNWRRLMKKLHILLYLLLIVSFYPNVFAANRPPKTKPIHVGNANWTSLNGPVKSVRVEIASAEEKSDKLVEGPHKLSYLIRYDMNGNPIEIEDYGSAGHNITKIIFYYNQLGKLCRIQEWQCSDLKAPKPSYKPFCKYIYKYDKAANPVKVSYYLNGLLNNTMLYNYDVKGKVTQIILNMPPDKLNSKVIQTYDSKGNIIEYCIDGVNKSYTQKRIYDSSGKPNGWAIYNKDGSLRERTVESYDGGSKKSMEYNADGKLMGITIRERDRIISQEFYNPDGLILRKRTRAYIYDTIGNPIKTIECWQNYRDGKPEDKRIDIGYQTIIYYK